MEARPHDEAFPKADAERLHAMKRAWDRYGLNLSEADCDRIVSAIKRHDARHLRQQSLRRSHWLWQEQGQLVIVVYDENRETLITFLELRMGHMPPEWYPGAWERHQQKRASRPQTAKSRRNSRQSQERAAKFNNWLDQLHRQFSARPA